ncbi:uncharacterized protein BCR38DRAFT_411976 [Pseudomassariella vexata]|uniref:Uncharacterized protein n=1 Tax=Pseudomassariella vexata TaxID=1141098 RepID=A0A1Y2DQD5_9PEZI|nr:uncharacterized protein BCR38DRAFT_411976 [Pseudomassariella vexata]ORY60865.1 hypothetical protein BCR38DRAFT_411976 [Pseudomassariella vexata]
MRWNRNNPDSRQYTGKSGKNFHRSHEEQDSEYHLLCCRERQGVGHLVVGYETSQPTAPRSSGAWKTLTVESVALLAGQRPFSFEVLDIGIEGNIMEAKLQKIFDLTGLWEALIGSAEVDVFLETRDTNRSDIQRNTIVSSSSPMTSPSKVESVSLLTTLIHKNLRLGTYYDEKPFVDVSPECKGLNEDQRSRIFLEFIAQLEKKDLVKEVKALVDEVGKSKEFNGRQTRNMVSTAMSLANASDTDASCGYLEAH